MMSNSSNELQIYVSEYYFRLTSECIRLHSNQKLRHTTLSEVVNERACEGSEIRKRYSAAELREHLSIIPTNGNISITIEITESSESNIDDTAITISEMMGFSMQFEDALSVILFDFVVEANSTEVLTKLGLTSDEARNYRKLLKKGGPQIKTIN